MRRMYFHKAAIVALALGLTLPGAEAENPEFVQLFLLFDPDSNEQLRRAQDLERATAGIEGIRVSGVVDTGDIRSPGLARLGFQVLSVDFFLQQDQSVSELAEDWFRSEHRGSLLLVKENGGTTTVSGDDFEETIHRLSPTPLISTEVDVTTWGKVKDLFN